MTLSAVIDVAIGLALLYLLLGLIASALQETAASMLKWRGKQLRDGIKDLLTGTNSDDRVALAVADRVFGHALVQGINRKGLPSYVPAGNFALAVFDVLVEGTQAPLFSQIESSIAALPPDMPARQSLTALARQAGGDLDKLRSSVESWYADAMDRLSGEYKRWSHYIALAFGLFVAIVFNVSTFAVAEQLWINPQARAAVEAIGENYVQNQPTPTDANRQSQAENAAKALQALSQQNLSLPIGWNTQKDESLWHAVARTYTQQGLWMFAGWLITALAVSLGAPFWFDTLQKLMQLRGSGPKPQASMAASSQGTGNA